jgi:hypothetical protein
MSEPIPIHLAVEDELSEAISREILRQSGRPFAVGAAYRRGGFGYLRANVGGFNHGAKGTPYLLLTDLDKTACPPTLIREWLRVPLHPNLIFRVAVREVEAWILADREAFARFLGIPMRNVPSDVDGIQDPKEKLIFLARTSPKRDLRNALVPRAGSTARVGRDYNGRLSEFIRTAWRLDEAKRSSPSLLRAAKAVSTFEPRWGNQ